MLSNKKMPHLGNILNQKIYTTRNTRKSIGEMIGKSHLTVFGYTKEPSLHSRILWDVSQAVNFDFFEMLSKELNLNGKYDDEKLNNEKTISKDNQITLLTQQVTDLQKEVAIYKEIVMNRK